ncbi:3-deoxy-manno-octulosonate cytidylyltransferase [bacterium]|nr:3-deoxy-manno-octulosonate cytidylyltransferase [bacterium]
MKTLGVIPARLDSTRLPGKLLKYLKGKPVIQWVWENASTAQKLDKLIIAVDSDDLYKVCCSFGAITLKTSPLCTSGTERAAEACLKENADLIVNIQGDEPFLTGIMIDKAVDVLLENDEAMMATVITSVNGESELNDPNVVKVVKDQSGRALYFSRATLPYCLETVPTEYYKHIGLYVYRRETLFQLQKMVPTPLERCERLEQLRALENGIPIHTVYIEEARSLISIDTEDDLERARQFLINIDKQLY